MNVKLRKIEIEAGTADALEALAAERGVSVSDLVAQFLDGNERASAGPAAIAELDRRWAAVKAGGAAVPHEDVVRWLGTWGTPTFKPWSDR